jgi:hypothetical protein
VDNQREKFILDALKVIAEHSNKYMNDWEKDFVKTVTSLVVNKQILSNHQFNKLMEIKNKY